MGMHVYHQALPGFDAEQILHDGCGECERRGNEPAIALAYMDNGTFTRACKRAVELMRHGLTNVSECELDVLNIMGAMLNHQMLQAVVASSARSDDSWTGDAWWAT